MDVTFNGSGGTFQALDTITCNGDFRLTAGTFDPNSNTVVLSGNTTTKNIIGAFTFYNLTLT